MLRDKTIKTPLIKIYLFIGGAFYLFFLRFYFTLSFKSERSKVISVE